MLTEAGFTQVLERLERMAIDVHDYREQERRLAAENTKLKKDLHDERLEAGRIERLFEAARAERDRALQEHRALYPLLIDEQHHVYVAFTDRLSETGKVQDDAGTYVDAGRLPDYAALIAAPLNPRCYLTCRSTGRELVRLPAPPTGKLAIEDNIPF